MPSASESATVFPPTSGLTRLKRSGVHVVPASIFAGLVSREVTMSAHGSRAFESFVISVSQGK